MLMYWCIKVSKRKIKLKDSFFHLEGYNFYGSKSKTSNNCEEILYDFSIKLEEEVDEISITNFLEDDINGINMLSRPKEIIEYIREYDDNIDDCVLFHNIRKKYICFVNIKEIELENNIVFVAFSLFKDEVKFTLKGFDCNILKEIKDEIVDCFKANMESFKEVSNQDLKWLLLKDKVVFKKENTSFSNLDNKFLKETINPNFKDMYKYLLPKITSKGYITKKTREELKKLNLKNRGSKIRNILNKSLLLEIEKGKFVILHNDRPSSIKEDDEKTIYTFPPRLWQYYMLNWFEDYVGEAIKKFNNIQESYKIKESDNNIEFNFCDTKKEAGKFEIDWIILVEKNGIKKIISMECKRTLSKSTYDKIREKYTCKIINTENHFLIDGFINIGYFYPKERYIENKFKGDNIIFEEEEYGTNQNKKSKKIVSIIENDFDNLVKCLEKSFDYIFDN
ncbi:hypothetical protein [Clostridium botulinum]|uniref:hypothetical protein n=1 Tax=Clostridium botulinum TaxID=1491 RepID=UPI003EF7D92F